MSKTSKCILDCVFYIVIYLAIQLVVTLLMSIGWQVSQGHTLSQAVVACAHGAVDLQSGKLQAGIAVLSSLLTIVLFAALKWSPVSRDYLQSKPWVSLIWVVLLTLGTILPSEFMVEKLNLQMPAAAEQMFQAIMAQPWGYAAIGILAPLAEEMVFRGGLLRQLLNLTGSSRHWLAIVISALVFGVLHLNFAQGVHAFIIGLLLGWMYYRTGSIVPGVAFHWVNNSVAYAMFHFMPQMADGKLIDLFHGSTRSMTAGLFFSFCILLPSLYQLALRLKRGDSDKM